MKRRVLYATIILMCLGRVMSFAQTQPVALAEGDTLKLTIEDALTIALNDNLQIMIANEEIKRVDYLKKENWYQLLPSLNGSIGYTYNAMKPAFIIMDQKMEVGMSFNYSAAAQMDVPIFAASMFKNIRISEVEMKLALESSRNTKLDLVQQVKNAFYGVVMMKQSMIVLNESYKNALESAQNIADKYKVGMASEYDMIRSDVSARNILPSLTQAESSMELGLMQLKMLLSIDMNTPLDVVGSFDDFQQEILDFMPDLAYELDYNSDLRSMDMNIEKMNKTFEMIRSQRYPSVRGNITYQYAMQENKMQFTGTDYSTLALGVSVSVPIFNKLQLVMKEKQTQAGIKQMEYQRELMVEGLAITVQNSINEMNRAKSQLLSDKEAVKQAAKGYDIAKVMYDTGGGTVLDLNTSEMALTSSQINLYQTIYNYLSAKNQLEKALGTADHYFEQ